MEGSAPARDGDSEPAGSGLARAACIAPALVAFTLHGLAYGRWLVDDAAITFAYARNIAEGHGPVQQPGAEPVEGYSNPLWLVAFVLGKRLSIFDSGLSIHGVPDYVWYPKLLALACFALTVGAFYAASRSALPPRPAACVAGLAGLVLASIPSYVIWAISGLENPLYGLCIAALVAVIARATAGARLTALSVAASAGALTAAAAFTRPDGLIYGAVYPVALLLRARPALFTRAGLRALSAWSAALGVPLAMMVAHRRMTFGEWLPNPAIAKGQAVPELSAVIGNSELGAYLGTPALLAAGALAAALPVLHRRAPRSAAVVLSAAIPGGLGCIALAVLKRDWMGELRFATPIWVSGALWLSSSAWFLVRERHVGLRRLGLAAAALWLLLLPGFAARADKFRNQPTVPMCKVADRYRSFHFYAERLGIRSGALVLPDLGGSLLTQRFRLIDSAGLTNRTIAHALHDGDRQRVHDYILDEVKPVFIHRHGGFLRHIARDQRFKRDYVAIVPDLDYVRRDVVEGRERLLAELSAAQADRLAHIDAYYEAHPRRACGAVLGPETETDARVLGLDTTLAAAR